MAAYYNENDKYCVQWLRNLIKAGLIADGDVDDRDIRLVKPEDVRGYRQAHFFAGLGGWSYALRLAQWPDDCEVWSGSCPCQPFSAAGKRQGTDDARHLWPEFRRLIGNCAPPVVFGEQVASKDGLAWFAGVRVDLEAMGNAVGAADIPAVGVGAYHIRQRLWFVANSMREQYQIHSPSNGRAGAQEFPSSDAHGSGLSLPRKVPTGENGRQARRAPASNRGWSPEPSVGRVAYGIPARVGRLRAYGNAIVPQVAAVFIEAAREAMMEQLYEAAA